MPISTQCPKCLKVYKLKDELLGKRVSCADQACRTLFDVKPYTPPPKPAAKPLDAEAIAAAAFNESADPVMAVPEDQRKIPMTCVICEEKFEVAWSMQGKNALCPSCKHRQKVPEQNAGPNKADWRNPNAKRPTLAKQEEVPDDVWGGKQANVSVGSLKEAGAIKGVEYEPRPVSFWVKVGSAIALVLILAGVGGYYSYQSKKQGSQLKLIDDAEADFATFKDAGISPTAAPQFQALMSASAAEFRIRLDSQEGTKAALKDLNNARQKLQDANARGQDRDAVAAELVSVAIAMGGSGDSLKIGSRIGWAPGSGGDRKRPLNQGDQSVVTELQSVFQVLLLNGAELDWRLAVLRRATKELEANSQGALAETLIGSGFKPEEQLEATATVALELARISNDLTKAGNDAENLKSLINGPMDAVPSAAHALWMLTKTKGAPTPPPTPDSGIPSPASRQSHIQLKLAQNLHAEALNIAKLPGDADERLKAIALVADLSPVPNDAVAAAMEIVGPQGPKPVVPNSVYARLARAAGAAGNDAAVEAFSHAITDEGWKVWAKADAIRAKSIAQPTMKADDNLPAVDDAKKLRVGNAWAKLNTFRQNVRVANSGLEQQAKSLPSGTLKPFALIGLALGAQDGTKK